MKCSMRMNEGDYGHVQLLFRNIAKQVPDTARKTMRRAAERIVKRAKLYAPVDSHALEESIRLEINYEFGNRGRLGINIVMGGLGDIVVETRNGSRVVDLDDYALIIHESYSMMEPGQKTVQKMRENPGAPIGERFLTRAYEDDENNLERDLITAVEKQIRSMR